MARVIDGPRRNGDVPPMPIALLGWFVRDGYIPAV